jgi:NAD(P)-dependent dehydrogenase (short-subunit alcohol dehydrogenase family)
MKIKGSVALVTGANRGLGLAFAKALLAAGAGKVYAGARDPSTVPTLPGLVPVRLDVTNGEQVAAAARDCADVTLLINNAGIAQGGPFLSSQGAEAARSQLDTNFFGTLAMARAFAPVLKANGGGAMVNMLSILSWISMPAASAYSASKAAAWSLTNGLRNELRAQGTQVVGVHAAFIDTDMARNIQAPKTSPEKVAAQTVKAIEEGREEVLADALTRQVKSALSAEAGVYLQEAGR